MIFKLLFIYKPDPHPHGPYISMSVGPVGPTQVITNIASLANSLTEIQPSESKLADPGTDTGSLAVWQSLDDRKIPVLRAILAYLESI